jgi:hypothetical protein
MAKANDFQSYETKTRKNTELDELRGAQMDFQRNAQWGDVCLKLICAIAVVDWFIWCRSSSFLERLFVLGGPGLGLAEFFPPLDHLEGSQIEKPGLDGRRIAFSEGRRGGAILRHSAMIILIKLIKIKSN